MKNDYKCSFCGAKNLENNSLIASPDGQSFICVTCIGICNEIVKSSIKVKPEAKLKLIKPSKKKKINQLKKIDKSNNYYHKLKIIKMKNNYLKNN